MHAQPGRTKICRGCSKHPGAAARRAQTERRGQLEQPELRVFCRELKNRMVQAGHQRLRQRRKDLLDNARANSVEALEVNSRRAQKSRCFEPGADPKPTVVSGIPGRTEGR